MGRNTVCPAHGSPEEINDFYIPAHRAPLIAHLGWKEATRGAPASLPFGVLPAVACCFSRGSAIRRASSRGEVSQRARQSRELCRHAAGARGRGCRCPHRVPRQRQECFRPTLEGSLCAISGRIYNRQSASHKIKAS